MIKTYDEALKKLNDLRTRLFVYATDECCSKIEECVSELDAIVKFFIYEKRKKPTLEEVEKEWEELGYNVEIGLSSVKLFHKELKEEIHIWEDRTYRVDIWLSVKENELITKTFKALGWFDE